MRWSRRRVCRGLVVAFGTIGCQVRDQLIARHHELGQIPGVGVYRREFAVLGVEEQSRGDGCVCVDVQ